MILERNHASRVDIQFPEIGMLDPSISHFDIVKKLGEGGMGVVYQAQDRRLARFVALKFLRSNLIDSQDLVARFEQEARAISALNHAGIATIHGIEQSGEDRFLVLEYLPGGTLSQKLEELKESGRHLPIGEALDYAIQIAEALKHAHDHGVIHRDMKASNVMFASDGRLKITDFGLAKLAEGSHLTGTGLLIGTPPHMSPEQAQGADIDHRSDIFSLGIILYQLFAGELPFRGASAVALMHDVIYTTPPPLDRFRSGIPIALQHIVSKALEKNRAKRYQSVGELIDDLQAARQKISGQVEAYETVTLHLSRFRPRRRWVLAVGVALLLAVVVSAIVMTPRIRETAADWLRLRPPLPKQKRIAILPFGTGDSANQAFSDGLNDILSSKLVQLEQFQGSLLVVAASEINAKGVKTPSDARKNFGVNLAVIGNVVGAGDQLQVLVNLVDTRDSVILRTATVEARRPEVTVLRDRIINRVTQMLDLELSAQAQAALQAGDTRDASAYTYFVQGRGYLQRYDRAENLDKAVTAFRQALAKDPLYALAYSGIAEAQLRKFNNTKDPLFIKQAFESCSRALELNESLAQVHTTTALVQTERGEYEQAEEQLRKALKLDSVNNALTTQVYRQLADAYGAMGRLKEAEEAGKKAIDLRPGDWTGYNNLGAFYFNHARFQEAEPYFQRAKELTPDNNMAYANLGAVYLKMGRRAEGIAQLEKSLEIEPSARAYSNLGMAYFLEGRFSDAAAKHLKAIELSPNIDNYWGNLAFAYRWDPNLASKAPDAFKRAIDLANQQIGVNPRDAQLRSRLALYWASLGDKSKSLEEIAKALAIAPKAGYVLYRAAIVYEEAGNRNRALQLLKAALQTGYSLEEIQKAPALKNLREDVRFRKLIQARASAASNTHN